MDPGHQCLAALCGDLELNGPACFLLDDGDPRGDVVCRADVEESQLDEIAAPQFAVDRQIEEGQIPRLASQLEADPDAPDLSQL